MVKDEATPAGWYPDPIDATRIRFHDGTKWTDRVQGEVSDVNAPTEAGWYPDPLAQNRSRYFNGQTWSDQLRTLGSPTPAANQVGVLAATAPAAAQTTTEVLDAPPSTPASSKVLIWIGAASLAALVLIGLGVLALRSGWLTDGTPAATPEATASLDAAMAPSPATTAAISEPTASQETTERARPPVMTVEEVTASSEMWEASWQRVTVDEAPLGALGKITRTLEEFSNAEPLALVETEPLPASDYNSMPGSYEHSIDIVPCPEPMLCVVKRGSVFPPGGASGVGILDALVLDYTTGNVVELSGIIGADKWVELAQAAQEAVAASGYPGSVEINAGSGQLSEFIPQDDGLLLYFGENVIGPSPVEVFVSWDEVEAQRSRQTASTSVSDAQSYICMSTPESKPPLVGADSDAEATRAIQAVIPWKYGYDAGPVDGRYGPQTIAAVKRMQSDLGVVPDGQVGPLTWSALQQSLCAPD